MRDVLGERFIFAVAQRPFEVESQSGVFNQFCALVPIFDPDGYPANPQDFPDNGDVWWMVVPGVRGLAEPGRLLLGVVEDSMKKGTPGLAQYQVVADSVESIRTREYVELLEVSPADIHEPRDLIGANFRITIDHPPLDSVYVIWRGDLLGRFRTSSERSDAPGYWDVRLQPESGDSTVLRAPRTVLGNVPQAQQLKAEQTVSLEKRPLHESSHVIQCRYHLVETDAISEALPRDAERLSMRSDELVIRHLAKRMLVRKKRQQLSGLLEELDDSASQSGELIETEDLAVVRTLRQRLAAESKAVHDLANAILESGAIENQLHEAIATRVEKYVDENAVRLQSDINKRVSDERRALDALREERNKLESEFRSLKSRKTKELESELAARRSQVEKELNELQAGADKQLVELKRQEDVLSNNLQKVAADLANQRDEVVNQFLTIAPLLDHFGLISGKVRGSTDSSSPKGDAQADDPRDAPVTPLEDGYSIPAFSPASEGSSLGEVEFFDRFKVYAEASGFRYREVDLQTFHVSVKCGALTVLGGLPGTGKSSLPRLYNAALQGSLRGIPVDRFLHVAVSPSWLDIRDLLGHVNALNQTFQPAESSLFQHLIHAHEEYQQLADDSCMYLVCLDEMNLAHVEHYFSNLLQVLEHPDGERMLKCFAENVVSPTSRFGRWSSVSLPRSLRFVGTVNFDETTKQLSQRLLDRVNLIRLPSDQLPLELEDSAATQIEGQPVRLSQFVNWTKDTSAAGDELGLLDSLREDLRVLNCPMNPRRFTAMRRFVASWPEAFGPVSKAVDLQLAQRVLPQVRGLFQSGGRDALDSIQRKLEQQDMDFAESLRVLSEIRKSEIGDLMFDGDSAE